MLGWKRIKHQVLEQDHRDDSGEGNYIKLFFQVACEINAQLDQRKEVNSQ